MTRLDGHGRRIVLVAAVADNGVIGNGPDIPWHVPGEQAGFKQLTMGHVLLMGRTTYETIGRPLPGRTTVVLTRDPEWRAEGVDVAHSLDEALTLAEYLEGDVMVAGGAEVYAAALPVAHAQVLTEVHLRPEGDVRYPDFDRAEWNETRREQHFDADPPWERVWLERA
jgi:dihydrofolate reductase